MIGERAWVRVLDVRESEAHRRRAVMDRRPRGRLDELVNGALWGDCHPKS